jgi:hypothetical protein
MSALPDDIQAALDAMDPEFRAHFVAAVEKIESPYQLAAIAKHLSNGDSGAALIVALAPSVIYAEKDEQMRLAFALGSLTKG